MIRAWTRYLLFSTSTEELTRMSWREWLGPALVATWVAGMGRYWDHPSAPWQQMTGVGSVIYVFVLSAILWLFAAPLRPVHLEYLQVVTYVALTSPLAWLYAIPVEKWLPLAKSMEVNAWFLGVVATWRVALLVFFLRRYSGLRGRAVWAAAVVPLVLIVVILTMLNLERAVFEIMAGLHRTEPTSADGAYFVLVVITFFSVQALIPLLLYYLWVVRRVRRTAPSPPGA